MQIMRESNAFPCWLAGMLGAALLAATPWPVLAFDEKPDRHPDAEVVGHLLSTNFTKQCDVSTYPLKKNLSFLFDNSYIGLEFQRWEVKPLGDKRFRVTLHYIDGEAGATTARWAVDLNAQKALLDDENAEVLSCMTGYL